MSKPAATVGCQHTCPQDKHVGGPATQGSTNVFINNKGACRQNDPMMCKKGIDKIAMGSTNVFINSRPSARLGDATIHGGKITSGSSNVFIG